MREALIFDYDGTLSPLDQPREKAYPPPELNKVLKDLSTSRLIGVASSKDYWFLRDRVLWAKVLGLITGLEVLLGDLYVVDEEALLKARTLQLEDFSKEFGWEDCVYVEVKKSVTGIPLGLSIDYKECGRRPPALGEFLEESKRLGLWVLEYQGNPFVDVYSGKPDKSRVLKLVRRLLGVERIYYFGDSENDLPAFQEADVKILVLNPYNKHLVSVLNFDHVVDYESLARWLRVEFNP